MWIYCFLVLEVSMIFLSPEIIPHRVSSLPSRAHSLQAFSDPSTALQIHSKKWKCGGLYCFAKLLEKNAPNHTTYYLNLSNKTYFCCLEIHYLCAPGLQFFTNIFPGLFSGLQHHHGCSRNDGGRHQHHWNRKYIIWWVSVCAFTTEQPDGNCAEWGSFTLTSLN